MKKEIISKYKYNHKTEKTMAKYIYHNKAI